MSFLRSVGRRGFEGGEEGSRGLGKEDDSIGDESRGRGGREGRAGRVG